MANGRAGGGRATRGFRTVPAKGGVGGKGGKKLAVSPATQAMSKRHHKENYQFNMKHMMDHAKEARHSKAKMMAVGMPVATRKVVV